VLRSSCRRAQLVSSWIKNKRKKYPVRKQGRWCKKKSESRQHNYLCTQSYSISIHSARVNVLPLLREKSLALGSSCCCFFFDRNAVGEARRVVHHDRGTHSMVTTIHNTLQMINGSRTSSTRWRSWLASNQHALTTSAGGDCGDCNFPFTTASTSTVFFFLEYAGELCIIILRRIKRAWAR
jgi:hypothetical protein